MATTPPERPADEPRSSVNRTAPPLRIAVVETHDAPPDTAANLAAGLLTLSRAADAGARLVVLPELFLSGYYLDQGMAARAATTHAALTRLQAAADELGIAVVAGLPELDAGRLLNTAAVLRPGRPAERYVKTHLYGAERDWFTPGTHLWTGDIGGWRVGVLICYELSFPEIARSLALGGASLLVAPAAFGAARARIWHTTTTARALENGCYLAAANQAGSGGPLTFLGRSRVVGPLGEIVAGRRPPAFTLDARHGMHRVWLADLDPEAVDAARSGRDGWHRSLLDRRPELYGAVTASPLSGASATGVDAPADAP